jgi:hypothetical protein
VPLHALSAFADEATADAYNRKIENLLARNLAGPLWGIQTSLGILQCQELWIASKPEKLVGVKTPKRDLRSPGYRL